MAAVSQETHSFQDHLNHELVRSELLRTKILFFSLLIGYTSGFLVWTLLPGAWLPGIFRQPETMKIMASVSGFLLALEGAVFWYMYRLRERGGAFNMRWRYFQSIMEVMFPGKLLLMLCMAEADYHYLDAPPFYLYYLFLVMTLLNLDRWLPVVSGAVAGFSYLGISYWVLEQLAPEAGGDIGSYWVVHLEKGMFLVMCGAILGFMSHQIRRRIADSYQAEHERNQVKMLFGQQVSPQVMDELLADRAKRGSKRLEVTVMFMDIRNFTPFAETRTPEEIIAFQNAVFGPIIEIIHQHGGIINQILGDGFMATFGAPVACQDHAADALTASEAMVAKMEALVREGRIPPTRIGIGLHTGEVVAGNIGNHIRQQYSITGTTVITAARIEQLNKNYDTQLLVSEDTFRHAPQHLAKQFRFLGPVQLKGRAQDIGLYAFGA